MIRKQGATLGFLSTSWVDYALGMHICGGSRVFYQCWICENAVCAPLFCSARDIVCIYIFSVVLALQSPLAR